jgi:uncharacterized membrane protein
LVDNSDSDKETTQELSPGASTDSTELIENSQIREVLRDPQVIEFLKDSQARGVFLRLVQHSEYSGPLPLAAELEAYEKVVPGSAERIVTWAEEEGKHRRALEQMIVRSGAKNSSRGAIFAFVIAVLVIATGAAIILTGQAVYGFVLVIAALTSLIGVFAIGRRSAARQLARTEDDGSPD